MKRRKDPIEVVMDDKTIVIHEFPTMSGLEIVIKFATCILPNSTYHRFQEMVCLLMRHVGIIEKNGVEARFISVEIIDKYLTMEEVLKILKLSLGFNIEWFNNKLAMSYLNKASEKIKELLPVWAESLMPFIIQIIQKIKSGEIINPNVIE